MNWKIYSMIITLCIIFIVDVCIVNAGIFGPDPTPMPEPQPTIADTWTPVDKCWTYQPEFGYGTNGVKPGKILYFITYVNQNGHHKIERVDIDTWYTTHIDGTLGDSVRPMYHQGS